jgi:uncharacterized protein (DUF1501 family)
MITRRTLLRNAGLGVVAASMPRLSFATVDRDVRLVLVILRGAVDGLAIAPPYGESSYSRLRGDLAIGSPGGADGVLKLDGLFGLHPSLANVHSMYRNGEAAVLHAVASPYRDRSHFDGQDVLENGSGAPGQLRDGWLNRAIEPLGGRMGNETAIALAQNTPLVLRGDRSVTSWAPSQLPDAGDETLQRIEMLYANDAFFATRLRQALESQAIAGDMASTAASRRRNDIEYWQRLADAAAKFLVTEGGPQIAVLEAGGWDTHANQGAANGTLANRLRGLDAALSSLRAGLGDRWSETVVAVVTEFGRTVRVNGTRGTDHGTGGTALLLGGAVAGGQVMADWPGLSDRDLYDGRDLAPTTDLRSVFKAMLMDHLGLDSAFVDNRVFPGSDDARPVDGLIRT